MHPALPSLPSALERLLESSWQAAALALLVLTIQSLLRRQLTPAWRHALWWIVLGRLLIVAPPASPWSVFNFLPQPPTLVPTEEVSPLTRSGWQPIAAVEPAHPMGGTSGATRATPPIEGANRFENHDPESSPRPPSPVLPTFLGSILTGIWGAGSLLLLGRMGLQNLRFARCVRALMRPAGPVLQARFDTCRRRMRVGPSVQLLEGDAVHSPAVYGLFRPRLLLPSHVAASASAESLDSIFLHELAHIRRGDLWVHALTRVLQSLHWFNPVLAMAFRRLRLDRELATDALALEIAGVDQRRAYGLTIVEQLERWSKPVRQPATVGIFEDNVSIERRIEAIARFRPASRWAPLSGILVVALAATSWTGAQAPAPIPAENASAPAESPNPPREAPPTRLESEEAAFETKRKAENARIVVDLVNRLIAETRFLFEAGDWRKAEEKIRRALELAPDHASALSLQKRIQDARRELEAGHERNDELKGRERIRSILESIRIPEVGFDRIPLEVAVRQLREMSIAGDPSGRGVNFFINPYLDNIPSPAPTIDPNTGQIASPEVREPIPLGDVILRIEPPLRDVSLLDVLKALTASAEAPIQFVVEDYAVVLMHKPPRHLRLVTRIFRINPERIASRIDSMKRILETNAPASSEIATPSTEVQDKVRRFFQNLGVSLLPPNAVFFNDRLGLLMVRAVPEEIEIVEIAVEALNDGTIPIWVDSTNIAPAVRITTP
ncbi:MAG: M56 family metallopeptidase [Limisphaerales bacterium]